MACGVKQPAEIGDDLGSEGTARLGDRVKGDASGAPGEVVVGLVHIVRAAEQLLQALQNDPVCPRRIRWRCVPDPRQSLKFPDAALHGIAMGDRHRLVVEQPEGTRPPMEPRRFFFSCSRSAPSAVLFVRQTPPTLDEAGEGVPAALPEHVADRLGKHECRTSPASMSKLSASPQRNRRFLANAPAAKPSSPEVDIHQDAQQMKRPRPTLAENLPEGTLRPPHPDEAAVADQGVARLLGELPKPGKSGVPRGNLHLTMKLPYNCHLAMHRYAAKFDVRCMHLKTRTAMASTVRVASSLRQDTWAVPRLIVRRRQRSYLNDQHRRSLICAPEVFRSMRAYLGEKC
jgi:hypothetical protein